MARRKYLPILMNHKTYRVFIIDVVNIHKRIIKSRPKIPKYIDE
jgi:hypothetical protein